MLIRGFYFNMIKNPQDAWIVDFIPQYSDKGRRLYHRRSSLTDKQRLVADFFDRLQDEQIITSETSQTLMAQSEGFMISFIEEDGKYQGLAYKKERGKDVQIITPKAPTRGDADRMLHQFIKAYNK